MASNSKSDQQSMTALELIVIVLLFLWIALSSALLSVGVCLAVLLHKPNGWAAAAVLGTLSLVFGWVIIIMEIMKE